MLRPRRRRPAERHRRPLRRVRRAAHRLLHHRHPATSTTCSRCARSSPRARAGSRSASARAMSDPRRQDEVPGPDGRGGPFERGTHSPTRSSRTSSTASPAFTDGREGARHRARRRGARPPGDRPHRPAAGRPVRAVTEGPFAETVEQLGGFWLVDLRRPGRRGRGREPAARELHASRSDRSSTWATDPGPVGVDGSRTPGARSGAACWPCSSRGTAASTSPRTASATRSRPPPAPGRATARRPTRPLAADRRPPPDPRPAARRGGRTPARSRCWPVESELTEEAQRVMADGGRARVRDERLRLVLLCAHPALATVAAAALSLRLVMGVATEDIARLFLVPTPTMAARLTRARKRLARERFDAAGGRGARRPARPRGRRRLPRLHRRLRARVRARRAPARAGRPRRSAWPGCCARSRRGRPTTSSWTPCWR